MFDFNPLNMIAGLPGLLIALVIHEYAHARAAVALGDFTPKMMGRLTLNPAAHIDPIGLIMLLLVHFGWAKPVVYNPSNFKDIRKGDLIVALAGPMANIIVGFIAMFLYLLLFNMEIDSQGTRMVMSLIVLYNVGFAIFNMLPLPPLDGSKVLMFFLPPRLAYKYMMYQRYSFIILIALMMTPILSGIMISLRQFIINMYSVVLSAIF